MKATYRVLALLIPVIVVLQASFIALAAFGIVHWVDSGKDITKSAVENGGISGDVGFMLHSIGADVAALVALLLLIVSFFAKVEGGVRAALFVFVDVIVQWVLAFISFSAWAVGIFHGLNAFLLFGLGMMAFAAANRSIKGTATASASSAAPMAETV